MRTRELAMGSRVSPSTTTMVRVVVLDPIHQIPEPPTRTTKTTTTRAAPPPEIQSGLPRLSPKQNKLAPLQKNKTEPARKRDERSLPVLQRVSKARKAKGPKASITRPADS